jgi:hypothetical protein
MPTIQDLLTILNIPLQIKSWKQVAALGLMIGALFWTFRLFQDENNNRISVSRAEEQSALSIKSRISAEDVAVFEMSPDSDELVPVWNILKDYPPANLTEYYRIELFQQLRQGDCQIEKGVSKDSNGTFMSGLVCPIIRKGKLIGAIAATYYSLPLKDSRGDIDPDAAELYRLGTYFGG